MPHLDDAVGGFRVAVGGLIIGTIDAVARVSRVVGIVEVVVSGFILVESGLFGFIGFVAAKGGLRLRTIMIGG